MAVQRVLITVGLTANVFIPQLVAGFLQKLCEGQPILSLALCSLTQIFHDRHLQVFKGEIPAFAIGDANAINP